ncbi:MAG TPA: hypothetical protein VKH43_10895 [Thermoanaerobaculia bacterium]|nr:hypothetical protein [Thermoanaerobaculia bacterium]
MRKLYFDIDGTLLVLDTGLPKPALARGRLERAIREARIDELVCVGNFVEVIRTLRTVRPEYDGLAAIFALCRGVFLDETWFRRLTRLILDPWLRAAEVDLEADWWYMDDQAERYFFNAGRAELMRQHLGERILQPSPSGDGTDVLEWLQVVASRSAP